jgi:phosphoribosylamine--glycine ligase
MKKILLLGSGGRESAIAWKLTQSPLCSHLFIAPGNAGTLQYGTNVPISYNDFDAIKTFCIENKIHILFPGPEEPLVNGITDFFKNDAQLAHIIVVGPSKLGAQLEGSKDFSKKFMQRHQIPTATYASFTKENYTEGIAYIQEHSLPIVLKADGLAAGKGVVIAQTHQEALDAFEQMITHQQFGDASATVVIEQFLTGIECSVFLFTDGEHYIVLPEAKDYKRIGEGDTGPNTGGMGAISPVPFFDQHFLQLVKDTIATPTVNGLKEENLTYQGIIFLGLIKVDNKPYVIEYNCRFGDPETEVVMPRIKSDLVAMIEAMHHKTLDTFTAEFHSHAAATVMLVAKGYPGNYPKGDAISGTELVQDSLVFHAGTHLKDDKVLTNGGRIIAVTSLGENIQNALKKSYNSLEMIQFASKSYRSDIGWEFIESN